MLLLLTSSVVTLMVANLRKALLELSCWWGNYFSGVLAFLMVTLLVATLQLVILASLVVTLLVAALQLALLAITLLVSIYFSGAFGICGGCLASG